jgi:hypothetical protein
LISCGFIAIAGTDMTFSDQDFAVAARMQARRDSVTALDERLRSDDSQRGDSKLVKGLSSADSIGEQQPNGTTATTSALTDERAASSGGRATPAAHASLLSETTDDDDDDDDEDDGEDDDSDDDDSDESDASGDAFLFEFRVLFALCGDYASL